MNVFLTRVLFAISAVALVACAAWLLAGTRNDASGMSVAVAAVGMLCAYVFGLLLAFFGRRYGEATIKEDRVALRYALAPRRIVSLADVQSATYFENLLLPSRSGGAGACRLVLHLANNANAYISPRDAAVARELGRRGVDVQIITAPTTPARARTLVPGSASFAESLIWPLFVGVAVVLPIAVVTWVLFAL